VTVSEVLSFESLRDLLATAKAVDIIGRKTDTTSFMPLVNLDIYTKQFGIDMVCRCWAQLTDVIECGWGIKDDYCVKKENNRMDFKTYSDTAWATAVYPSKGNCEFSGIAYCMLGLTGETGEIAEKIKKVYRDKGGVFDDETKSLIRKEIGDVIWYLNALAIELGFSLDEAAQENNAKLLDRMKRGVLKGSGDLR
jgi:NTP pyrophosphatase (non-canonical NTP hydrolase)